MLPRPPPVRCGSQPPRSSRWTSRSCRRSPPVGTRTS
jgi:hypothetical protein